MYVRDLCDEGKSLTESIGSRISFGNHIGEILKITSSNLDGDISSGEIEALLSGYLIVILTIDFD